MWHEICLLNLHSQANDEPAPGYRIMISRN